MSGRKGMLTGFAEVPVDAIKRLLGSHHIARPFHDALSQAVQHAEDGTTPVNGRSFGSILRTATAT